MSRQKKLRKIAKAGNQYNPETPEDAEATSGGGGKKKRKKEKKRRHGTKMEGYDNIYGQGVSGEGGGGHGPN